MHFCIILNYRHLLTVLNLYIILISYLNYYKCESMKEEVCVSGIKLVYVILRNLFEAISEINKPAKVGAR